MGKKVGLGRPLCFSHRIRKKGISAIVATVLIILITVAAVTIVWAAIIPMISNQLESGTVCLDAVTQLQLVDAGYTCVNVTGEEVSFQIKHGARSFDLEDVQILISSSGNTDSFRLLESDSEAELPKANEERTFTIDVSEMGAAVADIDGIQIAPIVSVGNTEKICDSSSSMVLREC